MCGRYTLRTSPAELAEIFALLREPELPPRYNIAPTQQVAVVRRVEKRRELSAMRWGLVPSWSKDPKAGAPMIIARTDSVATKPSFRTAFKRRRCLIPADGFYEWKKLDAKTKQPFHIGLKGGGPFAFAGLWECWRGPDNNGLESCALITTDANDLLSELHDRMPVILHEEDYDRWLDPRIEAADELLPLLVPFPSNEMRYYPVGQTVNNARNEQPECVVPAPDGA